MARKPMEEKICAVTGCGRTVYAKLLCNRHYQQMRRTKTGQRTVNDIITAPADRYERPEPECMEPGCTRTRVSNGYCNMHLQRARSNYVPHTEQSEKVCKVDGCIKPARTRQMCNAHYQAWMRANMVDGRIPAGV